MNNWFTVKVKYVKQLQNGCFKRVSEPYLVAAQTFGDAEARIYEELGSVVRGEFNVSDITKTNVHDIFHYEDSDQWFVCQIEYLGNDGDSEYNKKIKQTMLITAQSVEEASLRLKESLGSLMVDFTIPQIKLSPLVDVYPWSQPTEQEDNE